MRNQTPKVAKQEKKKKPKGRAYKRVQVCHKIWSRRFRLPQFYLALLTFRSSYAQYNRRFVNVVVGIGKKKGPNSNS